MDPFIAVPPRHYGGIERVIADLADALVERGHQVTLWAGPGSSTKAALEFCLEGAAFGYDCGDVDGIVHILSRFASDPDLQEQAQRAARAAAERRWHWEHPEDRGALLAAVAGAIR